jgi:hypothetical protein
VSISVLVKPEMSRAQTRTRIYQNVHNNYHLLHRKIQIAHFVNRCLVASITPIEAQRPTQILPRLKMPLA